MKKKIIVAGNLCIDITPKFPGYKPTSVAELLRPGSLIEMNDVAIHTGGAVANTGLAMKFLGADVSLMGKIGNDSFGDMIYNILKEQDLAEGLIRSNECSTSYSVVLAISGIDRIFLHSPGANHTFYADDIPEEKLQRADLFHFGYPPLMRSTYEHDGEELVKIFSKAKANGCETSLDMAAVDEHSDAGKADWNLILQKVLPLVDYFVPSVEELCYMLDYPRFLEWKTRVHDDDITLHLDIENDIRPLAERCLAYGTKVVMIKCGALGIYYRTAAKEGFQKSFTPEKVLSATGAGDTSIAAFLTAICEGRPLETCVQLAAATGASCVESYDSISGLRTFDELIAKINAGWS